MPNVALSHSLKTEVPAPPKWSDKTCTSHQPHGTHAVSLKICLNLQTVLDYCAPWSQIICSAGLKMSRLFAHRRQTWCKDSLLFGRVVLTICKRTVALTEPNSYAAWGLWWPSVSSSASTESLLALRLKVKYSLIRLEGSFRENRYDLIGSFHIGYTWLRWRSSGFNTY